MAYKIMKWAAGGLLTAVAGAAAATYIRAIRTEDRVDALEEARKEDKAENDKNIDELRKEILRLSTKK